MSGPPAHPRPEETATRIRGNADESRFPSLFRALAWTALAAGGLGSLAFMGYVGRRNTSQLLIALFTLWVLLPFLGLATGLAASRRWPPRIRTVWYGLTIVVALGSLAAYGDVAVHPRPQPAFIFIVVPPATWVLIAIVAVTAVWIPGRVSRRTDAPGDPR